MCIVPSCVRHALPLWVLAALCVPAGVASEPEVRVLKAEGSGELTSVAFSGDGRWLAQTEEELVRVWDLKAGKILRSWKPPNRETMGLKSVTLSPDGKRLAVANAGLYAAEILVYDPASGELVWRQKKATNSSNIELTFSPDGRRLVSTGNFIDERGKQTLLKVWDAASGELQRELKGGTLHGAAPIPFAPDGKTVAAVSGYGKVTLWDIESGKASPEIHVDKTGERFYSLAFSPDGKVLAVGTEKSVFLWDLAAGKRLRVLFERKSPSLLQWSADGAAVLVLLDGKLQAWDAKTGEARKATGGGWEGPSAYSADRKAVASGFNVYQILK